MLAKTVALSLIGISRGVDPVSISEAALLPPPESVWKISENKAVTWNSFLPPFLTFFEVEQKVSVSATLEGASFPSFAFTSVFSRVDIKGMDPATEIVELKFLAACNELLTSDLASGEGLKLSGDSGAQDTNRKRYEQCLHDYCATHDLVPVGKAGGTVSSCELSLGGVRGKCLFNRMPCRCEDQSIRPPKIPMSRIEGSILISADPQKRMRNQICLAELSALVFSLRSSESGRKSGISIELQKPSSSPVPAHLSRTFALELKLSTNAFVRKQFKTAFFESFKNILTPNFFVTLEKYSEPGDALAREAEGLFEQFALPKSELLKAAKNAGGEAVKVYGDFINQLQTHSFAYSEMLNSLMSSAARSESTSTADRMRGALVVSLRLDLTKIFDRLTSLLETGIKSESLNLLSSHSFLVHYLIKDLNLKNYIHELKIHHRQARRFTKLRKDMERQSWPSTSTLRVWEDECRVASFLSIENLKAEITSKLSHRGRKLLELRQQVQAFMEANAASESQSVPDSIFLSGSDLELFSPEMQEIQKEIKTGHFSLFPFTHRCPRPADMSFQGVSDNLEQEKASCLACIEDAEEAIRKTHFNGLKADWAAFSHFSHTLKVADKVFKEIASEAMERFVRNIAEQVSLKSGGRDFPLVQQLLVTPSQRDIRKYEAGNDEFFGQVYLNIEASEFSAFLLETFFAESSSYGSENAVVESKGFVREADSELCLVNFGRLTNLVCEKGKSAQVNIGNFVGPLGSYLDQHVLEWAKEKGFSLDGGEIDQAGLNFLFPSVNPDDPKFMVDCSTSQDLDPETVDSLLRNMAVLTLSQSPERPPNPSLGQIFSGEFQTSDCDALCSRRASGIENIHVGVCDFSGGVDQAECKAVIEDQTLSHSEIISLGKCSPLAPEGHEDRCHYGYPNVRVPEIPPGSDAERFPGHEFLELLSGDNGVAHGLSSQFLGRLFVTQPEKARGLYKQGRVVTWINNIGGLNCAQVKEFVGASLAEAANAPSQIIKLTASVEMEGVREFFNSFSLTELNSLKNDFAQALVSSARRHLVKVSIAEDAPEATENDAEPWKWSQVNVDSVVTADGDGFVTFEVPQLVVYTLVDNALEEGLHVSSIAAAAMEPEIQNDLQCFFSDSHFFPLDSKVSLQVESPNSVNQRASKADTVSSVNPDGWGSALSPSLGVTLIALILSRVLT